MKKLIIFDLDGTLLNTIADLAHSTNYALNKLGYPTHDVEKYNFMVGNGINKLFERALPEGEKTEDYHVLQVLFEIVSRSFSRNIRGGPRQKTANHQSRKGEAVDIENCIRPHDS